MLPLCRKTLVSPKKRPAKPPRTLGERLRAWRLERGLEQRDVAAMLGVRPATVGRWERDQRRPAIKFMAGVLALLGPDSSATQKTFPERLRAARQLLGLTQERLAEKLGVDRGAVGGWERGVRLPAAERLAAIEALLVARWRGTGLNPCSCSRPTLREQPATMGGSPRSGIRSEASTTV
jgi:transcriptional regulator with XRE-family HTH domain